jgi:hypothetical protein
MATIILNGGVTANYLYIDGKTQNSEEIAQFTFSDTNIIWEYTTRLLAKFNSSLNAGNVDVSELIENWKVYRTKSGETQREFVCEVPVTTLSIRDYMVSNNNTYSFTIFPITENYVGAAIYSDEIITDFYYWSLTDILTNEVWLFQLNVEEGNYTVNSNVTVSTNNTKYPVFNIGEQCYLSNTLTALIGNIDLTIDDYSGDTIKNRMELIEFLNNGDEKLFKNPRGDLLRVQTYTTDYNIDNKTIRQEQMITFNVVQVGTTDDLAVYEEITS